MPSISRYSDVTHLVFLLQLHDTGKIQERPLHTVQTLDKNQNLFPWAVRLWLALTDDLPEQRLESFYIIVLEHPYIRTAQSRTKTNRRMIQLVGDEETTLGDECGNDRRVGGKTHGRNESVLLANETGNQRFCGHVQLGRTTFESGAARGDAVATKAFLNCVCTPTFSGSKSEIVVRRNIETTRRRSGKGEGAVVILGHTVKEHDRSSWDARDRRGKTIIYTCLEPTGVEGIKVRIKRSITLPKGCA
jgi:hypothetical protein